MKRIKKILAFLLMITVGTIFAACSSKDAATKIDISALGNELLENVEFDDELSMVDDSVIKKLYNIENFVNAQVYISSGGTAEEIALFEFGSRKEAENGLKMAEKRIEEQKAAFELYVPKEIQRLDKAVVRQLGNYVITCVSDSSESVKEIMEKYLGK